MGKVKDGAQASKVAKASKGAPAPNSSRRRFAQFLANLFQTDLYKPMQGRYARLYTAVALGGVLALGLWRLEHDSLNDYSIAYRYGIPALLGLAFGWVIFRLVEYPPFVEFLIATEAEMNKVSWTSKDDLYRATTVVLSTVALVALFLFGVDQVWLILLQFLGVLKFSGGGAYGSTG
jgi:preprotein translocase subunit SecE